MKLLPCLLAMFLLQQPGPPEYGTLSGQLRDSDGIPMAGARVAVAYVDAFTQAPTALISIAQTDSAGRFRLERVLPGRYLVVGGPLDYPTYYPGVSAPNTARVVTVAEKSEIANLDFTLVSPPLIQLVEKGFVRMEDGSRLPGSAPLPMMRVGINGAVADVVQTPRLSTFHSAAIRNSAEIRAGRWRLLPGINVITVGELPLGFYLKSIIVGNVDFTKAPAAVLTTNSKVEVVLTRTPPTGTPPGVKVSGYVTNAESARTSVLLTQISDTNPGVAASGSILDLIATRGDGAFEFSGVPPGRYTLRALQDFAAHVEGSFGFLSTPLATINVAGSDISSVELRYEFKRGQPKAPAPSNTPSLTSIKGTVVGVTGSIPAFTIVLTPTRANETPLTEAVSTRDFSLVVPKGEYRLGVSGLREGYVLESISAGPFDLTEPFLAIEAGIADRITGRPIGAGITIRLKESPSLPAK